MHVDFKITNWERVEFSDELEGEVLEAFKKGDIRDMDDLIKVLNGADCEWDTLDCAEPVTPEENGGQATLEVYNGEDEFLFNNELTD